MTDKPTPTRGVGQRRGGLGRGLAALIPTGPDEGPRLTSAAADVVLGDGSSSVAPIGGAAPSSPDLDDAGAVYREIPPTEIEPNPQQPRTAFDDEALAELVHSIREFGLMQPIVCGGSPSRGAMCATSSSWASAGGGRVRRPASSESPRSSARRRTATCSGTPSWRTSTACS